MKRAIWFLRLVVLAIVAIVLFMLIGLAPEIWQESTAAASLAREWSPLLGFGNIFLMVGIFGGLIPFLLGARETFALLRLIEQKKSFSMMAVHTLGRIKVCAFAVCILYMAGVLPMAYTVAQLADGPGLILIAFVIGLSPVVFAVLAMILETVLQEAIAMKAENELTI
ncbi:MAG: DUF2975 domain-containing protein [Turicibacter sp.]|nr:DUF2975 domain-containing protein [Turicibacter sp.]